MSACDAFGHVRDSRRRQSPRRPFHRPLLFAAALCALGAAGWAAEGGAPNPAPGLVGIEEKLGGRVPLDLTFRDEYGNPIELGDIIACPTILALVYYNCPNVCDLLLTGIAGMIRGLDAEPGKDYRVIAVSIDENETPADARRAKRISLETIERPFPPEDWRFLTGDRLAIERLADSVGFRFARRDGGFDHPVSIMFLAPDGKVTHYIYGADFLPADVKLSLLSARQGTIAPTIAGFLRFCFRTDPASHRLVFATLRVVGSTTILLTLSFAAYLVLSGKRRGKRIGDRDKGRTGHSP